MADLLKLAVLIPVYNHEGAIQRTLESLLPFGYPILLVDDGSDRSCQQQLQVLQQQYAQQVFLLRLDKNSGKGAAVKAGLIHLEKLGFSHAAQVDADGQHDIERLPLMVNQAQLHLTALITGCPEYDESVPKHRYIARYLTHVWVWINTLSFAIKDSMCGFRIYPVAAVNQLLAKHATGDRMDFDTEVLVHWCWRGEQIINLPVRVHYPLDGVSHFRAFKDNVLISWMHTRLFFGMLRRLPVLLGRKLKARRY